MTLKQQNRKKILKFLWKISIENGCERHYLFYIRCSRSTHNFCINILSITLTLFTTNPNLLLVCSIRNIDAIFSRLGSVFKNMTSRAWFSYNLFKIYHHLSMKRYDNTHATRSSSPCMTRYLGTHSYFNIF